VLAGKIDVSPSEVKVALFGKGAAAAKAKRSRTYQAFAKLMAWADKYRKLEVWTNADQPTKRRRRSFTARRASAVPHRAHVLWRRPHRRGA
jgi:hypothetical protein